MLLGGEDHCIRALFKEKLRGGYFSTVYPSREMTQVDRSMRMSRIQSGFSIADGHARFTRSGFSREKNGAEMERFNSI